MNRRVLVIGDRAENVAQVAEGSHDGPFSITVAHTSDEAFRCLETSEIPFDVALIDSVRSPVGDTHFERRKTSSDRRRNANIELMAAIHARSKTTDLLLVTPTQTDSVQATLRTEALSSNGGFTNDQLAELLRRPSRPSYNESDSTTRLSHLLSVAASVSSSLELDDVLRGACWAARDLLRVSHAAIVLF